MVVAVGFVEDLDGSLLIAAGDPAADWAQNLEMNPACRVAVADRTWEAAAELLDASEAARAVTNLILKYGTTAERLGRGPAFRLRPVTG